ncbi:MAG: response regulator transcription factor [Treponema sp.]|nr:response regulator transcription factor [Candidatus Treponema equi]
MKNLIIVDDHAMLREGISSWILKNSEWHILIAAEDLEDLKKKFASTGLKMDTPADGNITVSVVDLSYKSVTYGKEEEAGWDIISWLKDKNIPTIVFSSHDSGHCIERAMSSAVGAKGFVSKCSTEKNLLEAINTVAEGRTYIQPDLFSNMIQSRSLFQVLSPKEQQVAELILEGCENSEISEKLSLNIRTVENYISKLYDKCGTDSRKELIQLLSV